MYKIACIFMIYLIDMYIKWLTLATSFATGLLVAFSAASLDIAAAWIPPKPIRRKTVVPASHTGRGSSENASDNLRIGNPGKHT
jgi:hypothetical protein